MKRIMFMHQASSIGGGSYCLLNLIRALDREKWDPIVALRCEGPLAEELKKSSVEVVYFREMSSIPYNKSLWKLGSLMAYRRVKKSVPALKSLLKEKHVDVLYLNNMMLCYYLQPAKEFGCKTIIHVREHWPLEEHKKQLDRARNCVYSYADKMIAINHYSASVFPKKESTIVYDWIDMNSRHKTIPMETIFGEDMRGKKVMLFTGGMDYIKGGLVIANTFINKIKDPNYRLLMLNVDTLIKYDGIRGKIRKILAFFGKEMRSDKLRRIVNTDKRIKCIPGIYELSHIIEQSYCMLSYFTIPHANLGMAECLILGTPVVAAYTEEVDEYSMGATPDLFFSINDEEKFFNSFLYLEKNYDKIRSDILAKSKNIKILFSKDKNIETLIKVLDSL